MVSKYKLGCPIETEAVVENIGVTEGVPILDNGIIDINDGLSLEYSLKDNDIVYGLGEANRGINKRGYIYVSYCSDDPNHTEEKVSLYGAHNFIVISGDTHRGMFFDYPGSLTFDIGYTKYNKMTVSAERADMYIYIITGESALDVIRQFRHIIGKSYIAPKYAFGFGQSRWGYNCAKDIDEVVEGYRANNIPLDMVYLDIDYMDAYKDFTISEERFPNFKEYVAKKKEEGIRLIPIIEAGVKIEDGYDIYEEGKEKGYFCKKEDGSDFGAAVWPGWTHFPDVLNSDARKWFGSKYKTLIDMGIEGFWNDMNEPAIFHTPEGIDKVNKSIIKYAENELNMSVNKTVSVEKQLNSSDKDISVEDKLIKNESEDEEVDILNVSGAVPYEVKNNLENLSNSPDDYSNFYHNMDGEIVRHDLVHNLYGYNMTRAAGEAFNKMAPDKRILLFSRSSYIGMHRYGGIWMGDNQSWWSHILLNLKMLPSLNMCGFLYTGADLGGFGSNTTRELLLRWLALGVFTPLMRNHSALGTREQECYKFENVEDFRHIIGVRYRLVPYLYKEYLRAIEENDMMFKPLGMVYTEDNIAKNIEDQLIIGDEIMIAPVYTQNATGRLVYLPEEMMFVKFMPDGTIYKEILDKGAHYVDVALNEVPLFIRKGKNIPIVDVAPTVDEIDMSTEKRLGY